MKNAIKFLSPIWTLMLIMATIDGATNLLNKIGIKIEISMTTIEIIQGLARYFGLPILAGATIYLLFKYLTDIKDELFISKILSQVRAQRQLHIPDTNTINSIRQQGDIIQKEKEQLVDYLTKHYDKTKKKAKKMVDKYFDFKPI